MLPQGMLRLRAVANQVVLSKAVLLLLKAPARALAFFVATGKRPSRRHVEDSSARLRCVQVTDNWDIAGASIINSILVPHS